MSRGRGTDGAWALPAALTSPSALSRVASCSPPACCPAAPPPKHNTSRTPHPLQQCLCAPITSLSPVLRPHKARQNPFLIRAPPPSHRGPPRSATPTPLAPQPPRPRPTKTRGAPRSRCSRPSRPRWACLAPLPPAAQPARRCANFKCLPGLPLKNKTRPGLGCPLSAWPAWPTHPHRCRCAAASGCVVGLPGTWLPMPLDTVPHPHCTMQDEQATSLIRGGERGGSATSALASSAAGQSTAAGAGAAANGGGSSSSSLQVAHAAAGVGVQGGGVGMVAGESWPLKAAPGAALVRWADSQEGRQVLEKVRPALPPYLPTGPSTCLPLLACHV